MHLKRWITSLVALPILGILIFRGNEAVFATLIGIVSVITLWEFFRIVLTAEDRAGVTMITWPAFVISPLIIWAAYLKAHEFILGLICLNLIFSGLLLLIGFKKDRRIVALFSKQILGVVYVSLFLSFLVLIRGSDSGIAWIAFLLVVIFAGDIAAYYVGSYGGRHKLAPTVSPGKTIEGAFGGLAGNLIVGAALKHFFFPQMSWVPAVYFFLSVGIIGQMGDLFESLLKRSAGIKDSGTILPGHGGILDRIDALLFAAPVAYLFKVYIL
jgi:phosphatidate cytidylyltransferase